MPDFGYWLAEKYAVEVDESNSKTREVFDISKFSIAKVTLRFCLGFGQFFFNVPSY